MSASILELAVERLGVSEAFLHAGTENNDRDTLTSRLAASLRRVELEGIRMLPSGPHHRLRSARKAAGYPSAMAAATDFGWSVTTYGVHESGRREIPIDSFFDYASAFGVDHDLLLFAEGPGGRNESQVAPMLKRQSGPVSYGWAWFDPSSMPVLRRSRRRFSHLENRELRSSGAYLASLAVMEKTREGRRVYLLAHPAAWPIQDRVTDMADRAPAWLLCDGQQLFQFHEPRGFLDDPLLHHGSKFRPLLLGRLLEILSF